MMFQNIKMRSGFIKAFIPITLLFVFIGQLKSQSSEKVSSEKIILMVEGMSCQKGCADGIDQKLKSTKGILKSKTNFEKSRSEIVYNPLIISKEEIIRIIQNKGYKVKMKS